MNRKNNFYYTGIIITIIAMLTIIISCETKPTEPKIDNPFDSQNPQTGGDPFNLTARIGEGRIILEWNTPEYNKMEIYKIYRSNRENDYYMLLETIDINLNKYYDKVAQNGNTYYYKIIIKFTNGVESSVEKQKPAKLVIPKDTDRAPTALFTISLDEKNTKLWHFNASYSYDYEEGDNLEYRWDFNNDGNWDTAWLSQDTISFTYSDTGDYYVTLSVRDNNHNIDETTKLVRNEILVRDIDGNVYRTTKIGEQLWMAENLKVTHYRNGSPIPNITGDAEWSYLSSGAYCNYNNNIANVSTYGRLYNWYAVDDVRNIAPEGWHVPEYEEWHELVDFLGGASIAGGKLKELGMSHWHSPNYGATNENYFTALPGGYRHSNGTFYSIGDYGLWWSYYGHERRPWHRYISYRYAQIYRSENNDPSFGYSIRCIKD